MPAKRILTGGCRLAGVDMADDDDVDVNLLLTVTMIVISKVVDRRRGDEGAEVGGVEGW